MLWHSTYILPIMLGPTLQLHSTKSCAQYLYTCSKQHKFLTFGSISPNFVCQAKRCWRTLLVKIMPFNFTNKIQDKFVSWNLPNLCAICHTPFATKSIKFLSKKSLTKKPLAKYLGEKLLMKSTPWKSYLEFSQFGDFFTLQVELVNVILVYKVYFAIMTKYENLLYNKTLFSLKSTILYVTQAISRQKNCSFQNIFLNNVFAHYSTNIMTSKTTPISSNVNVCEKKFINCTLVILCKRCYLFLTLVDKVSPWVLQIDFGN